MFTIEDKTNIPRLSGPSYPPIEDVIEINPKGVEKLLSRLDPTKASGPDNVSSCILKELAADLAPVLAKIYKQSLNSGQLPSDCLKADITPVYKKGCKNLAGNYRPVSLTCISCKLLEHIICSHIHKHLDRHGILTAFQHGFRARMSCETQLLVTLQDLLSIRDRGTQIDLTILDFSKAFDTVPHERLLGKLEYYGIQGPILNWTAAFLRGRVQRVVLHGIASDHTPVDSGVLQGTVLGPLLFLIHINDLPQVVTSSVRLFADDCLLYRPINSQDDQLALQKDLDTLQLWGDTWGMRFNVDKCNIMRISRSKTPFTQFYTLKGEFLHEVPYCKYLGINITSALDWSNHTAQVARKGHQTLGFIQRNLRGCPQKYKETAYISLVRSILEYSAIIWDPFLAKDVTALEKVQRKAARFTTLNYGRTCSVTSLLHQVGWRNLAHRRRDQHLTLLFKIIHGHIDITTNSLGLTKPDSRTHAKHRHKLQYPRASTRELQNVFTIRTVPEWNSLPAYLTESDSVATFKSGLARLERSSV